jgi:hypothetical protein
MGEAELAKRLERLERDNRRMKRLGVAAGVVLAALGAVYAARPLPQKVMAREFDVVDSSGRVRIRLSGTPFKASVEVLDAQGNRDASMEVDGGGPAYVTAGKDGGDVAALISNAQSGALVGVGYTPDWNAMVAGKSGRALGDALKSYQKRIASGPSVSMGVSPSGGADVIVQDRQGYSMDLGSTQTVTPTTGQIQQTSAASIVMFGNGKRRRVIWQAP